MKESLAKEWFRRVWNEEDASAIDELFAEDGEAYGIYGEVMKGPKNFRMFHSAFCQMLHDIRIEVVDEVENGDKLAIRCEGSATLAATGQSVPLTGTVIAEVRDRQLVRAWNNWDFVGLMEAAGVLPTRCFELLVSGKMTPHPQSQ